MNAFLLLLLAPLLAPSAQAQTTYTKLDEVQARLKAIRYSCFEQDWSRVKCESWPAEAAVVDYSKTTSTPDGVPSFIIKGAIGFADLVKSTDSHEQAVEIYSKFIDELKTYRAKANLSECHRACLATCITTTALFYPGDDPAFRRIDGDSADILYNGTGVCTQFSYLADDLMDVLGIKSEVVFTRVESLDYTHAYLRVRVNGKPYYMEPQERSCIFMPASK